MSKSQRDRGKRGEREVAGILRQHGYDAFRTQQYCGKNGNADVSGLPGFHIEVKRTERLRLYDAMQQSQRDAPPDEIPIVVSRADRKPWLVSIDLNDFLSILDYYHNPAD